MLHIFKRKSDVQLAKPRLPGNCPLKWSYVYVEDGNLL